MSKTEHAQVNLLLADGFDEGAVSIVSIVLRQAGLPVSLVGLRAKQVRGAHGLIIVPNTSLDRVLEESSPILALILPGGAGHLARLRTDPRVKNLLQQVVAERIMLVSLGDEITQMMIELVGTSPEPVNIVQPHKGMHMEEFASKLVQHLVCTTEVTVS